MSIITTTITITILPSPPPPLSSPPHYSHHHHDHYYHHIVIIIITTIIVSPSSSLHYRHHYHHHYYHHYHHCFILLLFSTIQIYFPLQLITEWNGGAKKCFAYLVNKMPDNAKILLDRCVVNSDDKPQSLDHHITYDFFLLEPTSMFL